MQTKTTISKKETQLSTRVRERETVEVTEPLSDIYELKRLLFNDLTDKASVDFYKTIEGKKQIRALTLVAKDVDELASLMHLSPTQFELLMKSDPSVVDIVKSTGSRLESTITSLLLNKVLNNEERTVTVFEEYDASINKFIPVSRRVDTKQLPTSFEDIEALYKRLGLSIERSNTFLQQSDRANTLIEQSDTEQLMKALAVLEEGGSDG